MGFLKSIGRRLVGPPQGHDYVPRFRDIVSDPLNLLIARHPKAGLIESGFVYLHNGLRVHFGGEGAYYGSFSDILAINRGVHEPLEEYVFQQLLTRIGPRPTMIELGAYWGHYSMWLKTARPEASVILVEPDENNLAVGRRNFEANGLAGEFIKAFVGDGQFAIDPFLKSRDLAHLDLLHADIQGYEDQMMRGAAGALASRCFDFIFVSTHSDDKHRVTCDMLRRAGYRVEVESDSQDTTSFDGLVFASSPKVTPLFSGFEVFGRRKIQGAAPAELLASLVQRSVADAVGRIL